MPEYVSKDIHVCACGKVVAWLKAKEGGKIPYEICREVTTNADGSKSAVVSSSDFHYCHKYPGIAKFIRERIERVRGGHIRIRLPVKSHERMVLTHNTGDTRARVTNGRSGKDEKSYGWINTQNGGYRVRTQSNPLKDLLDLLNESPVDFDWSRNQTQTECCFCGRELVDEHSVRLGYGPICAVKNGMPR